MAISIEGLPSVDLSVVPMGLCGGMAFLTRDIFESGMPQLRGTDSAKIPVALADFIALRLVQSFDEPGTAVRWQELTMLPDDDGIMGEGVFHQTVNECAAIMNDIDRGVLCPIGVVRLQSLDPADIFKNHVELVYGYDLAGTGLTLHVYDCNEQGSDAMTISLDIGSLSPPTVISTTSPKTPGATAGRERGFFRLPYTHGDPAPAYIDDAMVSVRRRPPVEMKPGSAVALNPTVTVVNAGSTSWTPAQGIRLGSQAPPDNSRWGTARIDLPTAQVDPQEAVVFEIPLTAPAEPGDYPWAWQMVRDPGGFFGQALTPPVTIAVESVPVPVVPDVLDFSAAEAEQAIGAAGLTVRVRSTQSGADAGMVAEQSPPGGTVSTAGAVVTIWVTQPSAHPSP